MRRKIKSNMSKFTKKKYHLKNKNKIGGSNSSKAFTDSVVEMLATYKKVDIELSTLRDEIVKLNAKIDAQEATRQVQGELLEGPESWIEQKKNLSEYAEEKEEDIRDERSPFLVDVELRILHERFWEGDGPYYIDESLDVYTITITNFIPILGNAKWIEHGRGMRAKSVLQSWQHFSEDKGGNEIVYRTRKLGKLTLVGRGVWEGQKTNIIRIDFY
jgi:hypothetical protein